MRGCCHLFAKYLFASEESSPLSPHHDPLCSHRHPFLQQAANGDFALVYLAPEKVVCWSSQLAQLARGPGILMFAVDEAHWYSRKWEGSRK